MDGSAATSQRDVEPADQEGVVLRRALLFSLLVVALPGPASAAARAWHLGDRPLRVGASGHDVRVLQDFLTRGGFRAGVDGSFGPATLRAVRRFQAAAGLDTSGVVGPKTVAALRRGAVLAPVPEPAAPAPVAPAAPTAGGATPTPSPANTTSPLILGPAGTLADGLLAPPLGAPAAVAAAIAGANRIAKLPYRWGGGHRKFEDTAYDCSGSVSYALHAAGLLATTMTSGELAKYGEAGPGRWITIYANADHVYAVMAGVRFDTSGQTRAGSRWQSAQRSSSGFVVRHPAGF